MSQEFSEIFPLRIAGRARVLLAVFEHHDRTLFGHTEGSLQHLFRVKICDKDGDALELRRLRQFFEHRRLRTAGGTPVGVECDRKRLAIIVHGFVMTLVKWHLFGSRQSRKGEQHGSNQGKIREFSWSLVQNSGWCLERPVGEGELFHRYRIDEATIDAALDAVALRKELSTGIRRARAAGGLRDIYKE